MNTAGMSDVTPSEEGFSFYDYTERVRGINDGRKASGEGPLSFLVETFGCQQNENDSERISGMLLLMGFVQTYKKEEADLILFNTCAVREHAEQRVFGKVGALAGLKRTKPSLKIGLCGCMVQQKHIEEKLLSYKYIDLVFGTRAIGRLPLNIYRLLTENERITDVSETDTPVPECVSPLRKNTLKAYITIMSGCNNFCSYCVVPYVRGREKSRDPEDVKNEFRSLVAQGYKDITLLGQNVNSYCSDRGGNYDFADLLRELASEEGEFRLRFMTSHPKDATEKLFCTIAENKKLCRHIHLPFQSGSDRILRLMNRRYTVEKYLSLIEKAKQIIPGVTFTSDVIVGFPTETEEDFQNTAELIKKVGFNGLFTFIYSPRRNTPAAVMDGQIDKETKGDRLTRLLDIQNEIAYNMNQSFIGSKVKVLTEGWTDAKSGMLTGRTDTNIIVNFTGNGEKINHYTDVTVDRALNWALFGTADEGAE